jgi:CubicO group peptidase (beta-lactamase class C family)
MSQSAATQNAWVSSDDLRRLDQAMQTFVDQGKVAGLATLIARRGQIIHQDCYGKLDLATGSPIALNSLFRLSSLTKPITSVAALMLHEKGYFDLHDPISKWIPEFKNLKVLKSVGERIFEYAELKKELTFWHLLTHTAGFGYGFEPEDPLADLYREAGFFSPLMTLQVTLPELIHRLVQLPLAHQPGEVFRYSLSYDVLAYMIELISGEPFDTYLREHVLKPLGMDDTGFFVTADQLHRLSPLYGRPGSDGLSLLEEPAESPAMRPDSVCSGGGGLISTVPDTFRFFSMLLNGGALDGTRYLKPETVKQMLSPQIAIPFRPGMGYGLGVGVQMEDQRPDGLPKGVFGWSGAGGTEAWADPQTQWIIMIMYQAFAYQEPARQFRSLALASLSA